jgi:ferredoxin-NADP reductase
VRPRRLAWRLAEVVEVVPETPRTNSLVLEVPGWEGHKAGQHVDVRLSAEDGYQAQRSYSIASAPEDDRLVLTVERLDEGEVSPYLLVTFSPPGDFERFVEEAAESTTEKSPPPFPLGPPDPVVIGKVVTAA